MTITVTIGQLSIPRLPFMEILLPGNLSHLLRHGCGCMGLPLPLLSVSRRKEARNFTQRDPGALVEPGGRVLLGRPFQKASKQGD